MKQSRSNSWLNGDRWLERLLRLAAAMSGCLTLLIVAFVFWQALPALRDPGVARFVSDSVWRPTDETAPQFGMTPMLVGSGLVTLGAVLLATPLALFSVIVAEFYSSRTLAWLLRRVLELLNGVPSVVFGFWGLVVLVPLINAWHPPGQSLLAGILVLTLMLIPTVALATDASLRAVPNELYRSAAALGIGRGAVVWKLAVPLARRGMVAGVLLGAARAVGETMAIVIVCGNIVQMPDSLFDPVRTITANIALEMGYATSGHRAALFATGLLLMLTSSLFVAGAGLLRRRRGRR